MITILFHFILSYSIPFHSHHLASTSTAGHAAETDGDWKNPYIIYARNAKPLGKIIRKKIRIVVDSIVLQCYTTVVPGGQGKESRTREKNLKKVLKNLLTSTLASVTIESRKQRTELVSEQKKSLLYETWTSNAGTVRRFSNLTTTLQSVTIKAQNNIKQRALTRSS